MTSAVPTALLADRIRRAGDAAAQHDVELLLVTPGADLRYLIGATGASHERLTCLLVPATGHLAPPAIVVPRLEAPGLAGLGLDELGVEVLTWTDDEDPYLLVSDLAGGPTRIAVADSMPAAHVFGIRDALPEATACLAGPVTPRAADAQGRRRGGRAARGRRGDRPGARPDGRVPQARAAPRSRSARTSRRRSSRRGTPSAAFVIVGSGPNGASPHHDVSSRVIESGELVVIDIGGPMPSGYHSDSTRTYAVGAEPPTAVREAYAVLQAAQEAAVAAVRPGVAAEQVDAAAREPITDAGMGERFVHRTGHGIGLEVHEEPYIVGATARAGARDGVQRRAGRLLRRRVGRPDRGHRGGHRERLRAAEHPAARSRRPLVHPGRAIEAVGGGARRRFRRSRPSASGDAAPRLGRADRTNAPRQRPISACAGRVRVERLLGQVVADGVQPAVHERLRVDGDPPLPFLARAGVAARLPTLGGPGSGRGTGRRCARPRSAARRTARGNSVVRPQAASARLVRAAPGGRQRNHPLGDRGRVGGHHQLRSPGRRSRPCASPPGRRARRPSPSLPGRGHPLVQQRVQRLPARAHPRIEERQ